MGLAMDELQSLKDLFRHMEWADSVVWTSVLANKEATKDAQLRDRLHHIHLRHRSYLPSRVTAHEAFVLLLAVTPPRGGTRRPHSVVALLLEVPRHLAVDVVEHRSKLGRGLLLRRLDAGRDFLDDPRLRFRLG